MGAVLVLTTSSGDGTGCSGAMWHPGVAPAAPGHAAVLSGPWPGFPSPPPSPRFLSPGFLAAVGVGQRRYLGVGSSSGARGCGGTGLLHKPLSGQHAGNTSHRLQSVCKARWCEATHCQSAKQTRGLLLVGLGAAGSCRCVPIQSLDTGCW